MNPPAPLCVTVLVCALDTGPRVDRVWRMAAAIGADGLRLRTDLPFEPGRPVRVEMTLPDQDRLLRATGVVRELRAPDGELHESDPEPERPRPRGVAFTVVDADVRERLARYVEERMQS